MKITDISPKIVEQAPIILAEIKKAMSILMHCHPSPDPDSVGSVLAMKFVLEGMGKKVTIINGDSDTTTAFSHFPGYGDIIKKNFFEVDLGQFDMFIALDSAAKQMVSRRGEVVFPKELIVIVIDHHATNVGFGNINLIESAYPANCAILFDLFQLWNIKLDTNIATNLFIGIYTDTGGFKYSGINSHIFDMASALAPLIDDIPGLVSMVENSNTPDFIRYQGLALSSVQTFLGGKLALALVPLAKLEEMKIGHDNIMISETSSLLRTVPAWSVSAAMVEMAPNEIKISFRSQDGEKYDVSKLAAALGGGGHICAAGATLSMRLEDAKDLVVKKAQEVLGM